jgi:hypothetical protein
MIIGPGTLVAGKGRGTGYGLLLDILDSMRSDQQSFFVATF